jgi:hypothetical protein
MNRACLSLIVAATGLLAVPAVFAQSLDGEVRLEGSGQHRAECDAMQLKPFDPGFWSHLSNWNGTAVAPESTKGKVVLLVTWTSYAKSTNNAAVNLAQRLHAKHADKGLIVAGVHSAAGFDGAKAIAETLGVTFPYAVDSSGKARAAIKADQDPDFFVIDRAGNLRFCDIETSSVERAVEILLAESAEESAGVPANVAKSAAERARDAMKSRGIKGLVQPGAPLTVEFSPPAEEEYTRASWPKVITKTGVHEYDAVAQKIAKDRPSMALNDEGWVTKPMVPTGRVLLIYTYDPLDTQIREVADKMSRLQTAHARDLVVTASLVKMPEDSTLSDQEKKERDERRVEQCRRYARDTALNHGLNTVPLQLDGQDMNQIVIAESRNYLTIAFMVSTDGHCRWIGNPYWDGFETWVKDFINADPGVQARRKAEDAQAKAQGR